MTFQNVSVQTDALPTKLMKDVALDQKGLIIMKDAEVLTDGKAVKRETGQFILTNSVSQLTEPTVVSDKACQTAIPRSEVAFIKLYEPDLEKIKRDLREFDRKSEEQRLRRKQEINTLLRRFGQQPIDPIPEVSNQVALSDEKGCVKKEKENVSNVRSYNTYANWGDIDFDDELPTLPRRTFTEGDKPWRNFKDLVLGNRLSNMTLSPILPRKATKTNKKCVTWSDSHQKAVNGLLQEASNLLNIFDQVSILLGPKMQGIPVVSQPRTIPLEHTTTPLQQIAKQDTEELAKQLLSYESRVVQGKF